MWTAFLLIIVLCLVSIFITLKGYPQKRGFKDDLKVKVFFSFESENKQGIVSLNKLRTIVTDD